MKTSEVSIGRFELGLRWSYGRGLKEEEEEEKEHGFELVLELGLGEALGVMDEDEDEVVEEAEGDGDRRGRLGWKERGWDRLGEEVGVEVVEEEAEGRGRRGLGGWRREEVVDEDDEEEVRVLMVIEVGVPVVVEEDRAVEGVLLGTRLEGRIEREEIELSRGR